MHPDITKMRRVMELVTSVGAMMHLLGKLIPTLASKTGHFSYYEMADKYGDLDPKSNTRTYKGI